MTSKLTIEQAKRLRNDFECWQQDYDPKDDKEQYDMFGRGMIAMDMLIAGMYQEPVAEVCEDYAIRYISSGPAPKEGLHPGDKLYRHAQQPVVPATLPCSVELKPGLIIGKGCKTETLLTALRRRADYNADIDAMTPEERAEHDASIKAFKAMLAAAPHDTPALNSLQSVDSVAGKWIPVSERMPESNGVYFGWDGKRVLEVNCFFGGWSANQFIHGEITHWMPLPAAPQEVMKDEANNLSQK
ncbi:DUF551 domain-containing protein [Klebsiella oxytoca]|uniref:DUF551 domain-containing protein n=1 Tax=Klebsiella oxytoca TaxID=571 RepID=UPI00292CC14E|nr:DUF551 domain-containing protein [Klebsiella oxytoca]